MTEKRMDDLKYFWMPGRLVLNDLLEEFAQLYSEHYGRWSLQAPSKQGEHIKLSRNRLREWLCGDSAVYYATGQGQVVGYAIAIRKLIKKYGVISWVTQLVVHKDFRNRGIAKRLLFSIWGLSDDFAWGILSANPYAIRALEKATRRRSVPIRIHKNIRKIMSVGAELLPYIDRESEFVVTVDEARVNTKFFVDHSDINEMLERVVAEGVPWNLGGIPEGWEWIAFTFRDQPQLTLSPQEIETMIKTSDDIAKQAYARMNLSGQSWMRHTKEEVEFIIESCGLKPGMSVIDMGCGIGRHANLLAEYGIMVTGIDYVDSNIAAARANAPVGSCATFVLGDCREVDVRSNDADNPYDAAICLYDVIGSYVSLESNQRILDNLAKHLKQGGMAVISVMNFELTNAKAKYKFSFSQEPNRLLELAPGSIMEKTGDVFHSEYLLLDEDEHIVYRREQFTDGMDLPKELVVRDRRFSMDEITRMCQRAGLKVLQAKYVSASNWKRSLNRLDRHAKEILLVCERE